MTGWGTHHRLSRRQCPSVCQTPRKPEGLSGGPQSLPATGSGPRLPLCWAELCFPITSTYWPLPVFGGHTDKGLLALPSESEGTAESAPWASAHPVSLFIPRGRVARETVGGRSCATDPGPQRVGLTRSMAGRGLS